MGGDWWDVRSFMIGSAFKVFESDLRDATGVRIFCDLATGI